MLRNRTHLQPGSYSLLLHSTWIQSHQSTAALTSETTPAHGAAGGLLASPYGCYHQTCRLPSEMSRWHIACSHFLPLSTLALSYTSPQSWLLLTHTLCLDLCLPGDSFMTLFFRGKSKLQEQLCMMQVRRRFEVTRCNITRAVKLHDVRFRLFLCRIPCLLCIMVPLFCLKLYGITVQSSIHYVQV
jgi:hypothetical protein